MANEIKQLGASKQESERRRKQAEGQLNECMVRLAEMERSKADANDKIAKLSVSIFMISC